MTFEQARAELSAAPTMRDQNRSAVMGFLLRHPDASRSEMIKKTGLSRSTISRIVDELSHGGYLAERETTVRGVRGRPSKRLTVAPHLGHVMGVDVGVTTCRMLACDLSGSVLARRHAETRAELPLAGFADWLADQVRGLSAEARSGRLRRLVVSFPAKIIDDIRIERPARRLAQLDGAELFARLSHRIDAPVIFRRDPDMALLGELVDGKATHATDAALIVSSTALATSVAINRRILGSSRKSVIGEFGTMPLNGGPLDLGDVLSVQGILDRAERDGMALERIDQIFDVEVPDHLRVLQDDFAAGLTQLVFALTLSIDPEVIVMVGRLLPLAELMRSRVDASLAERLPAVPEIVFSESGGFSQPRGAVETALGTVQLAVLDEVLRGV